MSRGRLSGVHGEYSGKISLLVCSKPGVLEIFGSMAFRTSSHLTERYTDTVLVMYTSEFRIQQDYSAHVISKMGFTFKVPMQLGCLYVNV